MTKSLAETNLATRAARKRLAESPKPYWRGIDPDIHIGYRKKKRGGVWLVRWRDEAYRQEALGTADDEVSVGTLDFNAAVRCARAFVAAERKRQKAAREGARLTVGTAIQSYISTRDARLSARMGRVVKSDGNSRLCRHVLGRAKNGNRKAVPRSRLAAIALHDLDEADLIEWREGLSDEYKPASLQRLMNDLRAALNAAYATNRKRLPATLPTVIKYGLRNLHASEPVDDDLARENQILCDEHVAALISAARFVDNEKGWDGDLFRMIVCLAATGSRFSQLIRLRVGDVQIEKSRLMVPTSRKGRGVKNARTPVPIGEDVLEVLAPATAGRQPMDTLLIARRSERVPGSIAWRYTGRGPWKTASELSRAWEMIRTRAGLPHVIPYAFRHSSIVRGIRANLPIRLVAAVHDTSVAIIERHYGRHIADGLDELAARAVVPLVQPVKLKAA